MHADFDQCYRAIQSRDARFDGWFVTAVATTGIYCRPSCPAITPKRANVTFWPTAAAAQHHGYRACKRCRPDASPGSPEWNTRADLVARAMRLIADGLVDRAGVPGLAAALGYSERHLSRQLTEELGAGPLAIARAQRAQTARVLIETTALTFTEIAFAAGFSSIRQFNDTVRAVFAAAPTELRAARTVDRGPIGTIALRLPYRPPLAVEPLFAFLARRAVPGVEEYVEGRYRRVLDLPHGLAVLELWPENGHVGCRVRLDDSRDLAAAVQRARRLLDLDADPTAVDAVLGSDSVLAPLVEASPGHRSPGHVDPVELAVRAVLGQQVSVAAARTVAGRLAARLGEPLPVPDGGLRHGFPNAARLATVDPAELPMPHSRRRTLLGLCNAVAGGELALHAGVDPGRTRSQLLALAGIGPWTADYIAMRAFNDPDIFLATDLGVRHAAQALGLPAAPAELARRAERWRPWRSYALHHLWTSLEGT